MRVQLAERAKRMSLGQDATERKRIEVVNRQPRVPCGTEDHAEVHAVVEHEPRHVPQARDQDIHGGIWTRGPERLDGRRSQAVREGGRHGDAQHA